MKLGTKSLNLELVLTPYFQKHPQYYNVQF